MLPPLLPPAARTAPDDARLLLLPRHAHARVHSSYALHWPQERDSSQRLARRWWRGQAQRLATAVLAGTLLVGLAHGPALAAQRTPNFDPPQGNPFGLADVGGITKPTFTDLDGDGDLDAFVGEYFGNFDYFQNTGSATAPAFAAPVTNPFGLSDVNRASAPTFADLDADGDLDALVGEYFGNFYYFQNTGSATAPAFAAATLNPFGLSDVGNDSTPTFGDLDGDGDLDALVGDNFGNLSYFQNTGNAKAPAFAARTTNPFGLATVGTFSAPTLADLDGDGDLDALVGDNSGNLTHFENTGSATAPAFAAPTTNPFDLSNVGAQSTPALADLDGDGDLDAVVGEFDGTLNYFENNIAPSTPRFNRELQNAFGLASTSSHSTPTFGDLDGDGDLDALIGEEYGNLFYFQNTGSATAPAFAALTTNPFGLSDVGSLSAPTFVDLDGDGDLDVVVGEWINGTLTYFRNTGSATAPAFAAPTINPFGLAIVGTFSTPTFADLDGDGDLDAVVGEFDGPLNYFQNTGSATSPAFAAATLNPFGLSDVGAYSNPTFADLDGDGDLDAFVGENEGYLYYFQNTGSASAPAFAAPTITPFDLFDVGRLNAPTFADLDGDGDLDAVVGEQGGQMNYFENTTPPLAVTFAGFTATAEAEQVLLRWETVSESNNQGFHLYRSTNAIQQGERINTDMIPSQAPGSSAGASYEWVDANVEAGTTYYYWLEAVDVDGTLTRHGPVSAAVQVPTAVTVSSLEVQSTGGSRVPHLLVTIGAALAGLMGLRRKRR